MSDTREKLLDGEYPFVREFSRQRLIDVNLLKGVIQKCTEQAGQGLFSDVMHKVCDVLDACPTADAVEVARIEETKQVILQTLDTLIATHRDISNSAFSEYEKHLEIPKSSNDYYGIYADVMEIARRLVNAALTDLCDVCGAKMDGGDENV